MQLWIHQRRGILISTAKDHRQSTRGPLTWRTLVETAAALRMDAGYDRRFPSCKRCRAGHSFASHVQVTSFFLFRKQNTVFQDKFLTEAASATVCWTVKPVENLGKLKLTSNEGKKFGILAISQYGKYIY